MFVSPIHQASKKRESDRALYECKEPLTALSIAQTRRCASTSADTRPPSLGDLRIERTTT